MLNVTVPKLHLKTKQKQNKTYIWT